MSVGLLAARLRPGRESLLPDTSLSWRSGNTISAIGPKHFSFLAFAKIRQDSALAKDTHSPSVQCQPSHSLQATVAQPIGTTVAASKIRFPGSRRLRTRPKV